MKKKQKYKTKRCDPFGTHVVGGGGGAKERGGRQWRQSRQLRRKTMISPLLEHNRQFPSLPIQYI